METLKNLEHNRTFEVSSGKGVIYYPEHSIPADEADDNKAKIMDLALGHRGVLNIGVTYSFGSILTETVLAFKKEFPDVQLNICYKNVMELMELVSDGELVTRKSIVRLADLEDYELILPSIGLQARNLNLKIVPAFLYEQIQKTLNRGIHPSVERNESTSTQPYVALSVIDINLFLYLLSV